MTDRINKPTWPQLVEFDGVSVNCSLRGVVHEGVIVRAYFGQQLMFVPTYIAGQFLTNEVGSFEQFDWIEPARAQP